MVNCQLITRFPEIFLSRLAPMPSPPLPTPHSVSHPGLDSVSLSPFSFLLLDALVIKHSVSKWRLFYLTRHTCISKNNKEAVKHPCISSGVINKATTNHTGMVHDPIYVQWSVTSMCIKLGFSADTLFVKLGKTFCAARGRTICQNIGDLVHNWTSILSYHEWDEQQIECKKGFACLQEECFFVFLGIPSLCLLKPEWIFHCFYWYSSSNLQITSLETLCLHYTFVGMQGDVLILVVLYFQNFPQK